MNPDQILVQRLVNRLGELEYLLIQANVEREYLRSLVDGNSGTTPGSSEVQQQA